MKQGEESRDSRRSTSNARLRFACSGRKDGREDSGRRRASTPKRERVPARLSQGSVFHTRYRFLLSLLWIHLCSDPANRPSKYPSSSYPDSATVVDEAPQSASVLCKLVSYVYRKHATWQT